MGFDVNVGGASYKTNYQTTEGTKGAQGRPPTAAFQDQAVSLGSGKLNFQNKPYLQSLNAPALAPVEENPNEEVPGKQIVKQTPSGRFYESFANNLQALAEKYGSSQSQVGQIINAHMLNVPADDTFLNENLAELEAMLVEEMMVELDIPSEKDLFKSGKKNVKQFTKNGKASLKGLNAVAKELSGEEKTSLLKTLKDIEGAINSFEEDSQKLDDHKQGLSALRGIINDLEGKMNDLKEKIDELKEQAGKFHPKIGVGPLIGNKIKELENQMKDLQNNLHEVTLAVSLTRGEMAEIFGEQLLGDVKEGYANRLNQAHNTEFEKKLENLPKELQAQLRFGHNFPELANPELKKMLGDLELAVLQHMQAKLNVPQAWKPQINNTAFSNSITIGNDKLFEQHLNEMSKSLTEGQMKQLRFMHYNPGAVFPGSKELEALFEQIESQYMGEFLIQIGADKNFKPKPDTAGFEAITQGEFARLFHKNTKGKSLSATQKNMVMEALKNPSKPISPEIKALINALLGQTVKEVRSQYALLDSWTPPLHVLSGLGDISHSTEIRWNAVDFAEEGLSLIAKEVNSMPKGSTKAMLLNVLKVVSEAISTLKEMIAIMQQYDSQIATKVSKSKLEASLDKIRKQEKEWKEIKAKRAKMKPFMALMNIFKPLMHLMTLMMSAAGAALGPIGQLLALAVAILIIVESEMPKGEGPFTQMFEAIESVIDESDMPEEAKEAMKITSKFAVIVGVGMIAGPLLTQEIFFGQSGLIQDIAIAAGADKATAETIAMGVQMAVQIIGVLVSIIVTMGGSIVKAIAKAAKSAAKAVVKVVKSTAKTTAETTAKTTAKTTTKTAAEAAKATKWKATKWKSATAQTMKASTGKGLGWQRAAPKSTGLSKHLNSFLDKLKHMDKYELMFRTYFTATGVAEISKSSINAAKSAVEAEIALIEGDVDAYVEKMEALIKVLTKMFNKILQAISGGLANWAVELGQTQSRLWKEKSEVMSNMGAA